MAIPLISLSQRQNDELRFFEFLFSMRLQGKKRNWDCASSSFPCVSRGKRETMVLRVPLFHASPGEKEELRFFEFLFSMRLQAKKRNWDFASSSFPSGSRGKRGAKLFGYLIYVLFWNIMRNRSFWRFIRSISNRGEIRYQLFWAE